MANDDLQRFIEELRARISVVDVVGAKVKLTKKGREHQGLCPFHNEKTPSFTVNETKGFYHCFGCGAHGDIVKFEMDANGLPFMDALQKLAHQAGLQMPRFTQKDKEQNEERKSLYEIMEQACAYFERELRLPGGSEGLKYFTEKRGLSKEIIQKFRLGFAPSNNGLTAHLKSLGVDEKDMNELGLLTIPEDKTRRPHDFFRNRVMIPITNKQGKIIAFGGRVMEKIEPKYLNSPETPIFNKRRNLYNLDKAREAAYQAKNLIICEGYMDVIALDRYGFPYAVAPLGTALTEEQITEAWKVVPEPILCLDGDAPGTKAAMRAVDRVLPILKAGYSLKFLFLPDNQDPDEYLQAHEHDSFAVLLNKTRPLIDILWQKYTENEDSSTPEKKALIEKTLLAEVAKIGDPTVRSYYAQEIRNRIYVAFKQSPWQKSNPTPQQPVKTASAIPQQSVNKSPERPFPQEPQVYRRPEPQNWQPRSFTPRKAYAPRQTLNHSFISSPETLRKSAYEEQTTNLSFIIAAMLIYPELIDDYEEELFSNDLPNNSLKELLQTMADIYHESETPLSGDDLKQKILEQNPNSPLTSLWQIDMLQKQNPFINDLRKNIEQILKEIKIRAIDEEIKTLKTELCENFSEETYTRLTALKQEKDNILTSAAEPEI